MKQSEIMQKTRLVQNITSIIVDDVQFVFFCDVVLRLVL